MWKYSNVCSKGVLTDRGLDLYILNCYCDFSFSNAVFRVMNTLNQNLKLFFNSKFYILNSTFFPGVYGAVEPH